MRQIQLTKVKAFNEFIVIDFSEPFLQVKNDSRFVSKIKLSQSKKI